MLKCRLMLTQAVMGFQMAVFLPAQLTEFGLAATTGAAVLGPVLCKRCRSDVAVRCKSTVSLLWLFMGALSAATLFTATKASHTELHQVLQIVMVTVGVLCQLTLGYAVLRQSGTPQAPAHLPALALQRQQHTPEPPQAVVADPVDGKGACECDIDPLAVVSHELRVPLTGIVGMTRMLTHQCPCSRNCAQDLAVIERWANQLLNTIDWGLSTATLDEGRLTSGEDTVLMADLVSDVETLAKWLSQQNSNTFTIECDSGVPAQLKFDEGRVRQILVNLIANAMRHCHQADVVLTINHLHSPSGDALTWRIRDTGPGMTKEELDRYWQPYQRSEHSEGMGIGLALVKQMVDALGGRLSAQSDVDSGTEISVFLPVATPPEGSARVQKTASRADTASPGTCPQPCALDLPRAGHRIIDSAYAQEALRYVDNGQISDLEVWVEKMRRTNEPSTELEGCLEEISAALNRIDLAKTQRLLRIASGQLEPTPPQSELAASRIPNTSPGVRAGLR